MLLYTRQIPKLMVLRNVICWLIMLPVDCGCADLSEFWAGRAVGHANSHRTLLGF